MAGSKDDWEEVPAAGAKDDWAEVPASQLPYAAETKLPEGGAELLEQQHPALSAVHRAIAANLGTTPESKAGYLTGQYPGYDFQTFTAPGAKEPEEAQAQAAPGNAPMVGGSPPPAHGGTLRSPEDRVYMRARSAKPADPWYAVDPVGFPDPTEVPKAALDRVYPAAASLAQGAASAAAGLAAAPETGGLGAIPAAMAAGGGTSAALEAARQGLGKAMGIPQNMDWKDVATQGVGGLINPLLFGTGATAAGAAKAGVPLATQRGIPSRLLSLATTGASSVASGIPRQEIVNGIEKLPQVKAIEKTGQAGVLKTTQDVMDQLREGLFAHQATLAGQQADILAHTGQQVNIAPAKEAMQGVISDLKKLQGTDRWTSSRIEELGAAEAEYRRLFQYQVPGVPENKIAGTPAIPPSWAERPDLLGPHAAVELRKDLGSVANFGSSDPAKVSARYGGAMSDFEKTQQRAGSTAYKALNSAIDDATNGAAAKLGKGSAAELRQKQALLSDTQDYLKMLTNRGAGAEDKATKTLMNLGSTANSNMRFRLQQLDHQLGTNVVDTADTLRALAFFGNKEARGVAQSSFGSTATEKGNRARWIGSVLGGLGAHLIAPESYAAHAAGIGLGGAAAGPLASPWMLRNYMNLGSLGRRAGQQVGSGFGLGLRPMPAVSDKVIAPWLMMQADKYENP